MLQNSSNHTRELQHALRVGAAVDAEARHVVGVALRVVEVDPQLVRRAFGHGGEDDWRGWVCGGCGVGCWTETRTRACFDGGGVLRLPRLLRLCWDAGDELRSLAVGLIRGRETCAMESVELAQDADG